MIDNGALKSRLTLTTLGLIRDRNPHEIVVRNFSENLPSNDQGE
jgi:hypothetical protein